MQYKMFYYNKDDLFILTVLLKYSRVRYTRYGKPNRNAKNGRVKINVPVTSPTALWVSWEWQMLGE